MQLSSSTAPLALIGAAWGLGASNTGCEAGPWQLQSMLTQQLRLTSQWRACISTPIASVTQPINRDVLVEHVHTNCCQLATVVQACIAQQQPFLTIGGDHTCAIGSWYGALSQLPCDRLFGLLWIDAHMDSHTFDTSASQQLHGMPLACLLGYGDDKLTRLKTNRVLDPKRVCLVGVRSFESGEAALLQHLGVKVFYMQDIIQQGLSKVLQQAFALVKRDNSLYGISIDLDGFDPQQVPGVGSPEDNGIDILACCNAFKQWNRDPNLVGAEIAEYNPKRDRHQKTQNAIVNIVNSLFAI